MSVVITKDTPIYSIGHPIVFDAVSGIVSQGGVVCWEVIEGEGTFSSPSGTQVTFTPSAIDVPLKVRACSVIYKKPGGGHFNIGDINDGKTLRLDNRWEASDPVNSFNLDLAAVLNNNGDFYQLRGHSGHSGIQFHYYDSTAANFYSGADDVDNDTERLYIYTPGSYAAHHYRTGPGHPFDSDDSTIHDGNPISSGAPPFNCVMIDVNANRSVGFVWDRPEVGNGEWVFSGTTNGITGYEEGFIIVDGSDPGAEFNYVNFGSDSVDGFEDQRDVTGGTDTALSGGLVANYSNYFPTEAFAHFLKSASGDIAFNGIENGDPNSWVHVVVGLISDGANPSSDAMMITANGERQMDPNFAYITKVARDADFYVKRDGSGDLDITAFRFGTAYAACIAWRDEDPPEQPSLEVECFGLDDSIKKPWQGDFGGTISDPPHPGTMERLAAAHGGNYFNFLSSNYDSLGVGNNPQSAFNPAALCNFYNFAHEGFTIENQISQIGLLGPLYKSDKLQLCIIGVGANNRTDSPATLWGKYLDLKTAIEGQGANYKCVLTTPIPYNDLGGTDYTSHFADVLAYATELVSGVPRWQHDGFYKFIDVFSFFFDLLDDADAVDANCRNGEYGHGIWGVHLTRLGVQNLTALIDAGISDDLPATPLSAAFELSATTITEGDSVDVTDTSTGGGGSRFYSVKVDGVEVATDLPTTLGPDVLLHIGSPHDIDVEITDDTGTFDADTQEIIVNAVDDGGGGGGPTGEFPTTDLYAKYVANDLDDDFADGDTLSGSDIQDTSGNNRDSVSITNATFNRQAFNGKSAFEMAAPTGSFGALTGGGSINFGNILNGSFEDVIIFHCGRAILDFPYSHAGGWFKKGTEGTTGTWMASGGQSDGTLSCSQRDQIGGSLVLKAALTSEAEPQFNLREFRRKADGSNFIISVIENGDLSKTSVASAPGAAGSLNNGEDLIFGYRGGGIYGSFHGQLGAILIYAKTSGTFTDDFVKSVREEFALQYNTPSAIVVDPPHINQAIGESQIYTVYGVEGEVFFDIPSGGSHVTVDYTGLDYNQIKLTRTSDGDVQLRVSQSPLGRNRDTYAYRLIGNDDGSTVLNKNGTQTGAHSGSGATAGTAKTGIVLPNVGDFVQVRGTDYVGYYGGSVVLSAVVPGGYGGIASYNVAPASSVFKGIRTTSTKWQIIQDGTTVVAESDGIPASALQVNFAVNDIGVGHVAPRPEYSPGVGGYRELLVEVPPPADPPSDCEIGSVTVLGQNSIRVPITTAATDAIVGMSRYDYEIDTVNTFDSVGKITGHTSGTTGPFTITGLSAGYAGYIRFKGRNTADVLSVNWSSTRAFTTWAVGPTITEASPLQSAELGVAYHNPIAFSGGDTSDGPVVISVESGFTLPSGFSVVSNAVDNANPGAIVVAHATRLKAVDSKGQSATKDFTFNVSDTTAPAAPGSFTATFVSLTRIDTDSAVPADPSGISSYDTQVAKDAGFTTEVNTYNHAAHAYSVTANLNPAVDTVFYLRRRARDNAGTPNVGPFGSTQTVSMIVPVIITTGPSLPGGFVGVDYTQTLAKTGGSTSGSWSIAAQGAQDVAINSSTGQVTLNDPASGTVIFTARWTDLDGQIVNKTFTFHIAGAPPLVITSFRLPDGTASSAYSQQIGHEGGTGTIRFAIVAGALPAGYTMSETGLVTGTTATRKLYWLRVKGYDEAGQVVYKTLLLLVKNGSSTFAVWCSQTNYRAGHLPEGNRQMFVHADPNNIYLVHTGGTGPITYDDFGAGGTFVTIDSTTVRYIPRNERYIVTITGTDFASAVSTISITVTGTLPLPANWGEKGGLSRETKTKTAKGGTQYFRSEDDCKVSGQLDFDNRDDAELQEMKDFWNYHDLQRLFYFLDIDTGDLYLVRFTSDLTWQKNGGQNWDMFGNVKGTYTNFKIDLEANYF